ALPLGKPSGNLLSPRVPGLRRGVAGGGPFLPPLRRSSRALAHAALHPVRRARRLRPGKVPALYLTPTAVRCRLRSVRARWADRPSNPPVQVRRSPRAGAGVGHASFSRGGSLRITRGDILCDPPSRQAIPRAEVRSSSAPRRSAGEKDRAALRLRADPLAGDAKAGGFERGRSGAECRGRIPSGAGGAKRAGAAHR